LMMEAIRPSETSILTRATGVLSQKMIFFIVTAVKTSNLTRLKRFSVHFATSHHGAPNPFREGGTDEDSVTGICSAVSVCSLSRAAAYPTVSGGPARNYPEDSDLSWGVEATQWVLLCLSIGHERCCAAAMCRRKSFLFQA
jgi:hypothetical protein